MKFFQIGLLLALCFFALSCRETLGEQHRNTKKERVVPSSNKQESPKKNIEKDNPNRSVPTPPKPAVKEKDKKQDTLKPRRAIP